MSEAQTCGRRGPCCATCQTGRWWTSSAVTTFFTTWELDLWKQGRSYIGNIMFTFTFHFMKCYWPHGNGSFHFSIENISVFFTFPFSDNFSSFVVTNLENLRGTIMGNTPREFPFHRSVASFGFKESRDLLGISQSSSLSHSATTCPPSIYPEKETIYQQS